MKYLNYFNSFQRSRGDMRSLNKGFWLKEFHRRKISLSHPEERRLCRITNQQTNIHPPTLTGPRTSSLRETIQYYNDVAKLLNLIELYVLLNKFIFKWVQAAVIVIFRRNTRS